MDGKGDKHCLEMCYNGTLVMPINYAVVNDNEMEYVDGGGIYISNSKLHTMTALFMCAYQVNATLVAAGMTAVATTVSRVVSKITKWIGSAFGGVIGSLSGWAIGAYCGWEFGKAYFTAMVRGKGIDIGWGFKAR